MLTIVRCGLLPLGVLATGFYLPGQQLPLRHYTTADGLASNAVYSIAGDSRGFLWFATSEGLSRFDGFAFTTHTAIADLPRTAITQVLVGRHGNYWLATPIGLIRFRPDLPPSSGDRMTVMRPGGSPVAADIQMLLEARSGALWCGTEAGLYEIEDTAAAAPRLTEVKIGLPGVSWGDSSVSGLAEDAEGGIWIGTVDGTLYHRVPDGQTERFPTGRGTSPRPDYLASCGPKGPAMGGPGRPPRKVPSRNARRR